MQKAQDMTEIAVERHGIIAEIVFAERDGADSARVSALKKKAAECPAEQSVAGLTPIRKAALTGLNLRQEPSAW